MRSATILGLTVALAGCTREVPPPAPPPAPVTAGAPPPAVAPPAPRVAVPPAADCAERPLVPSTVTCAAPPADVVARARATLAQVIAPGGDSATDAPLSWSCELARGWLVQAAFLPRPAFRSGDPIDCPPAVGECGVSATWLVPPRGAVQQQRGVSLVGNLDVDGDGRAETLTRDQAGTTVWFDAGKVAVPVRAPGVPTPWQAGYAWLALDGSPTRGFVRETATAFRVTPAGVTAAPEIVAALWPTTVAARCPVADVIAASNPAAAAPPAAPACGGDVAIPARAAMITDAIVARERARGLLVAEGAPAFQWSCHRAAPAVAVTYCEGEAAGACGAEHGTWIHELWAGTPAGMHLVRRTESGSVHMEWSVTGESDFVTTVDLDGDGEPEPVLDDSSHEGGATLTDHTFSVVIGGALQPLVSLSLRGDETTTWSTAPGPGHAQTLVLVHLRPQADDSAKVVRTVRAWTVTGGKVRALPAAAARALAP